MLNKDDRQRIADAVTAAEEKTSGEITCVLIEEVSHYREVPLAWAALVALCLPPLAVLAGLHRYAPDFSGWSDGRITHGVIAGALSSYALAQAVLFTVVVLVVALPRVRRALTPGGLKTHRVRQVARHHFTAVGARREPGMPHILIFVSLKDRRVELVAHQAIHDAVGQGPWNAAVVAVSQAMRACLAGGPNPTTGFVRAVEICGAALAAHYPATCEKTNHLSNEIEEI